MSTVDIINNKIIIGLGNVDYSLSLEEARSLLERLQLAVKEAEIAEVYNRRNKEEGGHYGC